MKIEKISIVVPVYNSAGNIEKNLESLLKFLPKGKNIEVVVSDDGSTDNTASFVESFISGKCSKERGDISFILVKNKHLGPAGARNSGWRTSAGDVVIFLDGDCEITKNWLDEMLKPFEEDGVIAAQGVYENSCSGSWVSCYIHEQIKFRQDHIKKYTDVLATYSLAVDGQKLNEIGGFDETFTTPSSEDTDLSYRLVKLGRMVLNRKAVVRTCHSTTIWKYFRKQMNHARWRVSLYLKHPNKASGDKYTNTFTIIQPIFASLSVLSLFHPAFILAIIPNVLIQMIEVSKSIMPFKTLVINMVRTYVWVAGMAMGVFDFLSSVFDEI